MSGQPSLWGSKRGTPVALVSRMYFLVFTPPKTTASVRPASLAVSVKCARGLGLFLGSCAARKKKEKGKRRASEIQESLKWDREGCIGPEIMNSWHTKVRVK